MEYPANYNDIVERKLKNMEKEYLETISKTIEVNLEEDNKNDEEEGVFDIFELIRI